MKNTDNIKKQNFTAAIETLGCRVNQYESRALAEALEKIGISASDFNSGTHDIYIINTCAVTKESERKSRQFIRRALKRNPHAIVAAAGCASQLDRETMASIEGISIVAGTRNKSLLADEIKNILLSGKIPETPVFLQSTFDPDAECFGEGIAHRKMDSQIVRTRAYVKIEDGCAGKCAYCIIPSLRGKVSLRSEEDILREIERIAACGCHEVVLTGIETAAYGERLASLIASAAEVDGIERIRLGSMDPAFLRQTFIDKVAQIPEFMPHFHVSLQSGCSRTLASMRRRYNAEMALENIEYIRKKMPRTMFSADIICGFPGETDDDFAETLEYAKKVRLLHAHIFTYSRRPGTPADKMPDQIDETVKNSRSSALLSLQKNIKKSLLDDFIASGERTEVLFETQSDIYCCGHTDNFIEVRVKSEEDICGKILRVIPISHDGDTVLAVLDEN